MLFNILLINNFTAKIPALMNFFNKMMSSVFQRLVEDQFSQPLTEHQIYAVINQTKIMPEITSDAKLSKNKKDPNAYVFAVAEGISQHTHEIEFRLLGYEPSIQAVSGRVCVLKQKLSVVENHLLSNYQLYLEKIAKSLQFYSDGKQFYSTRKKSIELRAILQKMNRILVKVRNITKLNIHISNLKNTLKILQKIPNIKKMGLMELKSINLDKLQKTNQELQNLHTHKLICLQNLSKYIVKVNNESFVYIINNLKNCIDSYQIDQYEDIIRSYMIIQPSTGLDKLLISLMEEKVRAIFDLNIETPDDVVKIGHKLINIIINLHKILKWHLINRAVKIVHNKDGRSTRQQSESEEIEHKHRRISIDSNKSNRSEQSTLIIEINEIVYINISSIKSSFSNVADICLTDAISDHILSKQPQSKLLYQYLYAFSKICQINQSFTGLTLDRLKRVVLDYFNRQQFSLYVKCSKELIASLEQQKNDWNRFPYHNNFRFKPIDRLLYRQKKMNEVGDFTKISSLIQQFFGHESEIDFFQENDPQQLFEMNILKTPSTQRLQKSMEEWNPKQYLQLYKGDVIVCQSSLKVLTIFQKYLQFLIYTPKSKYFPTFLNHMLIFIEYKIFFIFNSLLGLKYRNIFYEQYNNNMTLQRKYTLRRMYYFYPELLSFFNKFKTSIETNEQNYPVNKYYHVYKREIKDISGDQKHILKAKVISTESCKFALAYFNEIARANKSDSEQSVQLNDKIIKLQTTLTELSTLLLTQSSQGMVGIEMQTIRTFFQSIRWFEPYQQLKQYIVKIISIVKESYDRLKSCHRGQIPLNIIHKIFVLVWRTIVTYCVKLFLESKSNNKKDNKLNFQKFIDEIYLSNCDKQNIELNGLNDAFQIFKTIFPILLYETWQQSRDYLIKTAKNFDYIYPILTNIMQNTEFMNGMNERQKESVRNDFKTQIQNFLKEKK